MSGSSGTFLDHHARKLLANTGGILRVLDIGPGWGKYSRMVRELCPGAHLTCAEIDDGYIREFALASHYDIVLNIPGAALMDDPEQSWDMVILGDVLEHMRKSEGVDLLHFLVYRTRYLWIQVPMRYVQGVVAGHVSEAHVSVWTEDDIRALNADYLVYKAEPLEAYAVNGYINTGRHVYEVMEVFPHG